MLGTTKVLVKDISSNVEKFVMLMETSYMEVENQTKFIKLHPKTEINWIVLDWFTC